MTDEPLVLGIETSCDETGVGIVRGHTLLADAVASSVDEHARFGGVVPEVASRAHLEAMVPTIERACDDAGIALHDVDAIAVTSGPGLAGALLVGVAAAKALALGLGKPIYGVNHLAAHVAVDQLEHGPLPEPCVALLVSGGHSSLLLVERRHRRTSTPLGATIDDAAGEAFDKVARLLGLPFPGGPHIDRAARAGVVGGDRLPARADRRGATWSGTASTSRSPGSRPRSPAGSRPASAPASRCPVADVAASFQEAVCDVLTRKAVDAAASEGVEDLLHRRRRRGELPAAGAGRGAGRRARASGCGCRGPGCAPTTARWSPRSARSWWPAAGRPSRARPARRLVAAGHVGPRRLSLPDPAGRQLVGSPNAGSYSTPLTGPATRSTEPSTPNRSSHHSPVG